MTEDLTRGNTEDTGAELANSEPGAASQGVTGAEGAEQLIGQASVTIGRPAAGEIVQISAEPGSTYVLDFDPSQARAVVEGDNLILVFEDGGQIVFENLVSLAQLEGGPSLQYAGEDIIALLQAQGIIPGVLEGFELTEPEPGQIIEIQAALGLRLIINFDPALAQVSVDGDNLVMTFPNGGQIVIVGLGGLADDPNAPVFNIAGADIPAATLLQTTIALAAGEAGPDATATLETAAGGEGPVGTGATQYSDDLGDTIDTLAAQGVIPPVEGDSVLIDLEVVDPEFIVEDVPPPTLSINDVTVTEGDPEFPDATITFTVTRSGDTTAESTVSYTVVEGSATDPEDYNNSIALLTGTITFAAGETTKTIALDVTDDLIMEPTETFTVVLSGATNATISDDTGVGTILDNDTAKVSVGDAATGTGSDIIAVEGDSSDDTLTFTISLDQTNNTGSAIKVFFTLTGDAVAGTDYTLPGNVTDEGSGTYSILIADGTSSEDVVLTVVDDSGTAGLEGDESVLLTPTGTDTTGVTVDTGSDSSVDGVADTGAGTITDSRLATSSTMIIQTRLLRLVSWVVTSTCCCALVSARASP